MMFELIIWQNLSLLVLMHVKFKILSSQQHQYHDGLTEIWWETCRWFVFKQKKVKGLHGLSAYELWCFSWLPQLIISITTATIEASPTYMFRLHKFYTFHSTQHFLSKHIKFFPFLFLLFFVFFKAGYKSDAILF